MPFITVWNTGVAYWGIEDFSKTEPLTRAMAEQLLKNKIADNAARISTAYQIAYGRFPNEIELQRALEFVEAYTESLIMNETKPDEARVKAWQSLCRVILSANEFIYVE